MLNQTISLILGGGVGSRLYPLTKDRSKPAVPVGGKYNLIDIPISNCLNSGMNRMFVLTQFNSASLNQHIKNTYHFDAFNPGFVDILAAEQTPDSKDWFQGTADAVRQSMHHLSTYDFDYVLILSGDQLYQMDFAQLIDNHLAKAADLTIATIPVTKKEASNFGIMKVNNLGLINKFIEKPPREKLSKWTSTVSAENEAIGKVYLASMGIYLFSKKALNKLFLDLPNAHDFGKEIIPMALSTGYKVASYQYDGYWTDIGNIRSFFEANLELADELPRFNLFDNQKRIFTRPRMLAPSKLFGTCFEKAVLAEGGIIHAKQIKRSIIGIRSRIGEGTVINNTIIFGNDYFQKLEELIKQNGDIPMGIGKNCQIENAIIDKNCRIGDNVIIQGAPNLKDEETAHYCIREGIVVLKKGVVIPDNTVIGVQNRKKEQIEEAFPQVVEETSTI